MITGVVHVAGLCSGGLCISRLFLRSIGAVLLAVNCCRFEENIKCIVSTRYHGTHHGVCQGRRGVMTVTAVLRTIWLLRAVIAIPTFAIVTNWAVINHLKYIVRNISATFGGG